jgi:uncharacterized membrane protein YdjX (TVP38/TMEM64 family)
MCRRFVATGAPSPPGAPNDPPIMSTDPGSTDPSIPDLNPSPASTGDPVAPAAAGEPVSGASLLRQLGPAGVLGALWTFLPAIVGTTMLVYLDTVSKHIQGYGSSAIAVYVGLFVVTAGLGLLPTYTQAILAGWCFGLAAGFPAALGGFVGASIVGYFVARTVARKRVQATIDANPKARVVRDALIGHGWLKTLGIVTLLRLPPNSPFALTNLVMSSTGVRLPIFVIGTLVGMAPRTFLAVYIGHSLRIGMHQLTGDEIKNAAPWWALYAGPGLMILVMVIIAAIAQRALQRFTHRRPVCAACGEDLRGQLDITACPRCGAPIATDTQPA